MTIKIEDAEHSSLVGGSTAGRRLACPASYQMEAKVPKAVRDKTSPDAEEGTALHAAMAFVLRNGLVQGDLDDKLLGKDFDGYVMTRQLIDEAIVPCLDFIDDLLAEHDDEDLTMMVERRVEMPGIPNAFGTADVIARTSRRTIGIDWKFGVGVPVSAGTVEAPNAQLCFYNRGGMHSFPVMYGHGWDWPVDMYIVQPRVYDGDKVSHVRVTTRDLEDFRRQLVAKIVEAQSDSPRLNKGDHCRFAPCKVICPAFTGPALDLTKLGREMEMKKTKSLLKGLDVDWGDMYGELLTLADIAEEMITEIRSQAHVFMGDGNKVPGWKLVPKRATERYREDGGLKAAKAAVALGVPQDDTFEPRAVKSPARLRDTLAPLCQGKTVEARKDAAAAIIGQFTVKASSGTTIAHDGDPRPNIIPAGGALLQLADKLKALAAPSTE